MARATSSLTDRVLLFAQSQVQPNYLTVKNPKIASPAARSIGYGLYALLWTLLAAACLVMIGFVLGAGLTSDTTLDPTTVVWLVVVSPLAGWFLLMLVAGTTSQAALMWALAARAVTPAYSAELLAFNAGARMHPLFLPVRQTRYTAWWTFVSQLGWSPSWPVLASSSLCYVALLVVTTQVGRPAVGSLAQVVACVVVLAALVGAVWLFRIGVPLSLRPTPAEWAADEKYLAGVASRERARQRKVARVREAGLAEGSHLGPPPTAFDTWIRAEVDQVLREQRRRVVDIRSGDESAIQLAVDAASAATLGRATPERLRKLVTEGVTLKRKRKPVSHEPAPGPSKPQPPKRRR
ncbi:hypothetical protein EYE40_07225 [Glaciihabitans arcticus]|uniref:Uncharacterized protein n=1 Tax=Glaciihabitans arcticus TaxID=2668039 RepID=A0A4Q9GRL0_9MICO|nr:hypothetical protein [Glaciihabitans arcticus]TBN57205.1 hypothetical protein EYE40_07225 [Glaciihabitans arcticus]